MIQSMNNGSLNGNSNGVTVSANGHATYAYSQFANSDSLWFALVNDSHSSVMILGSDGVVEYANQVACAFIGKQPSEVIGRNYAELFDEHHAAERLGLMTQVMKSGNAIAIDGMVRGVAVRTVYRPVPGSSNSRVLLTSRLGPTLQHQANHLETLPVVRARADDYGKLSTLTAREMEILKHIGEGLSTADIAKKLHRSVKTIEWHRVSLGNKLGVSNRVELARIAIAAGIVNLHTTPVVSEVSTAAVEG